MEHINTPVSFGKNETFFLKYNWTYKSLVALNQNKNFFNKTDAYLDLGVGKNMLSSIKYWMSAYEILDNKNFFYRDEVSEAIFHPINGLDPYLEREETLWIMHWRLSSNINDATLYYWFFNKYKNTKFTKDELIGSLNTWLNNNTAKKISPNTLDRDVNLLLKTYTSKKDELESVEDHLENPFTNLELIYKNSDNSYSTAYKHRDSFDYKMLTFFILILLKEFNKKDLFTSKESEIVPFLELIDSSEYSSIRNIFRLSENYLMNLIEKIALQYNKYFDISETAGQRNFVIKDNNLSILELLGDIYK